MTVLPTYLCILCMNDQSNSKPDDPQHRLGVKFPLSKSGSKHAGKYEAVVDEIDSDLAEHNWSVARYKRTMYAKRGLSTWLHRVVGERVLGGPIPKGMQVDHLDADGLNNRRSNIRVVSRADNQRNARTNSASGYKGVWCRENLVARPWGARIKIEGRNKALGQFANKEDAARAYNRAQRELDSLGLHALNRVETRVTQRRVTATPVAIDRRIADRRISQWYTT